jgi:hypothetical protein
VGREHDELWQLEAKKVGGDHLIEVIEDIRDTQHATLKQLDDMDKRVIANTNHIDLLQTAFPSNDVDGHRRYHQLIIDNTEAKRNLTKAIKEKTISGLLWSVVVWLATEVWTHLPKLFEAGSK